MMTNELRAFFEDNELAKRAADSIRNGREIAIVIRSSNQSASYTFTKESGRNVLRDAPAAHADLTFTIPEESARELVTAKFESVGQVGLHIFNKMLSNDPNQKITAKLHAGMLSLVAGGYLGVLTAGGSEVAKFLATKGLGNVGKIKDALSKMKG